MTWKRSLKLQAEEPDDDQLGHAWLEQHCSNPSCGGCELPLGKAACNPISVVCG